MKHHHTPGFASKRSLTTKDLQGMISRYVSWAIYNGWRLTNSRLFRQSWTEEDLRALNDMFPETLPDYFSFDTAAWIGDTQGIDIYTPISTDMNNSNTLTGPTPGVICPDSYSSLRLSNPLENRHGKTVNWAVGSPLPPVLQKFSPSCLL